MLHDEEKLSIQWTWKRRANFFKFVFIGSRIRVGWHSPFKDNQLANEFLNGLLNQLNWSFSEFIGMLQEVRRLSTCLY